VETYIPDLLDRFGFEVLAIDLAHALRAGTLPRHHGDPFDRMIVAQGQVEDMPIVTADPLIGLYDVETIW
jgi:PIN domain nuclease of toxin-antitoxin system